MFGKQGPGSGPGVGAQSRLWHSCLVLRPGVLTRDEGPAWAQKPPRWGREAFSLWWPWRWSRFYPENWPHIPA